MNLSDKLAVQVVAASDSGGQVRIDPARQGCISLAIEQTLESGPFSYIYRQAENALCSFLGAFLSDVEGMRNMIPQGSWGIRQKESPPHYIAL
jgi:hypothetical protein